MQHHSVASACVHVHRGSKSRRRAGRRWHQRNWACPTHCTWAILGCGWGGVGGTETTADCTPAWHARDPLSGSPPPPPPRSPLHVHTYNDTNHAPLDSCFKASANNNTNSLATAGRRAPLVPVLQWCHRQRSPCTFRLSRRVPKQDRCAACVVCARGLLNKSVPPSLKVQKECMHVLAWH